MEDRGSKCSRKSLPASAEIEEVLERRAWIESLRPVGRKGYPDKLINAMRADYTRLKSVEKVGQLWGITRQSAWDILQRRRFTYPKEKPTEVVEYKGQRFVPDKDNYLRCTSYDSRKPGRLRLLHHIVWNEHNGPIPEGHILVFKDDNRHNCAIENLQAVTRSEFRRQRGFIENGWTKYRRLVAEAEKPWLEALAKNAPDEEVRRLRAVIDAIPKPRGRDFVKHREFMKNIWANYTPEQRAERVQKSVKARTKKSRQVASRHVSIQQKLNHVGRLAGAKPNSP